MNQVILTGRVVRDCEINILQNQNKTNVMKFTLAVERDYKNKNGETPVDFINIEMFGNDFTRLKNYVLKGDKVGVIGSLHIEKGDNKFFTKIKATKLELLGTKNSEKDKNLHLNPEKGQKEFFNPEKNHNKSEFSSFNPLKVDEIDINGDDDDVPF